MIWGVEECTVVSVLVLVGRMAVAVYMRAGTGLVHTVVVAAAAAVVVVEWRGSR